MDKKEKIIYLVKRYECLYNTKAKKYSDKNSKKNAWQNVASEMKLSESECQKLWKRLRDCYKKGIRLRQFKSGSARTNIKPIKYEKELEFLKPHLQTRPQMSNLDRSEENHLHADIDTNLSIASPPDDTNVFIASPPTTIAMESFRSNSHSSHYEDTTRKKSQPLSQMLFKQYAENKKKEDDPTDSFILNMPKTVKQMPIEMQVQLKQQILILVTDAEIKLASNELSNFVSETTTQQLPTQPANLQFQSDNSPYDTYPMHLNTSMPRGYNTTNNASNAYSNINSGYSTTHLQSETTSIQLQSNSMQTNTSISRGYNANLLTDSTYNASNTYPNMNSGNKTTQLQTETASLQLQPNSMQTKTSTTKSNNTVQQTPNRFQIDNTSNFGIDELEPPSPYVPVPAKMQRRQTDVNNDDSE